MKHLDIQLGDFVGQKHPKEGFCLKKGIVVVSKEDFYAIQWLSYNKDFFMEHESSVFRELNEDYLLIEMSYNRNYMANIVILSKAG
jgi:hypothetical protein